MKTLIPCLDHGFVRLVSYMQPVPVEIDTDDGELAVGRRTGDDNDWTGDLEVVRSARVSYDADWRTGQNEGKDAKLLNYLVDNHHTSPFESMVFTFEVKAPIFVFRQWHRHRTWSYNEVSARYTEMTDEFYVPKPEHIGRQSSSNKQARDTSAILPELGEAIRARIEESCKAAFEEYRFLHKDLEVPRELARGVLPVNTYSRMFATVDLHNLMRFLTLRLHLHAQWEIQQYARALLLLARQVCPVSLQGFPALVVENVRVENAPNS